MEALITGRECAGEIDRVSSNEATAGSALSANDSVLFIREIHKKLLDGVRGSRLALGERRRTQNWIGPSGCTLSEASFVPPPPDIVADALSALERFLHNERRLPLLIKIGLAHVRFETIHPFLDGNGRVGRLLITFLLCEGGVLHKPVLYLSHYFRRHRQAYYDLLQSIRDRGQWEAWLNFFLRGVSEVSVQATETARRIFDATGGIPKPHYRQPWLFSGQWTPCTRASL